MGAIEGHEAAGMLAEAGGLRRRTRAAGRFTWFPLVLFGLLTIASAAVCSNSGRFERAGVFWLVAGPVGYAAVYAFAKRRETRQGIGQRVGPYLAAGLTLAVISTGFAAYVLAPDAAVVAAAVAVAVVASMLRRPQVAVVAAGVAVVGVVNQIVPILFYGSVLEANTAPVIGVAIALLVLAWYQRSVALGLIAVAVGVMAGLSGLFILDNLFDVLPHCGADLSGIGAFMVVSGAGMAVAERAMGSSR
jgi:hypothetical protein